MPMKNAYSFWISVCLMLIVIHSASYAQSYSQYWTYDDLLTTEVYADNGNGVWYFCNNLIVIRAQKPNGDYILLDFNRESDNYYYTYDPGCAFHKEYDGPCEGNYGLYKSTMASSTDWRGNVTYYWYRPNGNSVMVYNSTTIRGLGFQETGVYSQIRINGTNYKLRYGDITVTLNNAEGMFIESNGVQDYDGRRSFYFTIGNRSEHSLDFENGTLANNGSSFTISGSNGTSNITFTINQPLRSGKKSYTTNDFNLANIAVTFQGKSVSILEIKADVTFNGSKATSSVVVRDNNQNVYCFNITPPEHIEKTDPITLCSNELPYTWREITYPTGTISGIYTYERQTVNGCDSGFH